MCGRMVHVEPNCVNYNLLNNLKNNNYMHRCSVRVYLYLRLSYLNTSHALCIKIEWVHLPSYVIMLQNTQIARINLTSEKRDEITIGRRADHKTVRLNRCWCKARKIGTLKKFQAMLGNAESPLANFLTSYIRYF